MEQQEKELWEKFQKERSESAKERLIRKYAPFVKHIANRIKLILPPYIDIDDLFSYGIFGLLDALEKYDYSKGIKFETYAYSRIKGSIYDGLRKDDILQQNIRSKIKQVEEKRYYLHQKLGRSPTDDELSSELNISKDELFRLYSMPLTDITSLNELLDKDYAKIKKLKLSDLDPEKLIENNETKRTLGKAIDRLPEKEKLVVTLYYYEGLTQKEISEVLELSESRVSQLHSKSILRLRGSLGRKKQQLI